jgi:hypothetical protein
VDDFLNAFTMENAGSKIRSFNMYRNVVHSICTLLLVAGASAAVQAQTIDLKLDLVFSNPANDQSGGTFRLAALSSGGGGISGLVTRIDFTPAILSTAVPNPFPLAATPNSPATFGWMTSIPSIDPITGLPVNLSPIWNRLYNIATYPNPPLYQVVVEADLLQDTSLPAGSLVYNIGHGAGTPGDQGADPFGLGFNNAALFATGTFAPGFIPKFSTIAGLQTEGNVFSAAGNSTAIVATVSTMVRNNLGAASLVGDYNNNGAVDAADYVLWRNGGPLQNDPTPGVQPGDYNVWRSNFGKPPGAGSGSAVVTAVPEPATWLLILSCLVASAAARNKSLGRAISR